jgi:nitroreductase
MSFIGKIIPVTLKNKLKKEKARLSIINDFYYDYKRYLKYSSALEQSTREQMQAYLIFQYHAVEKGLTFKNIRVGFGVVRILQLIDALNIYLKKFGKDETTDITVAALKEYLAFDKEHNTNANPVIPKIEEVLKNYEGRHVDAAKGGTKTIRKDDILNTVNFDFESFFKSRFSTRDFTDEPVPLDLVMNAIDIAKYAPSVCNRQAWKVFVIDHNKPELKSRFLEVQNGNKGFGDRINTLLIVTGKLSSFYSFERNQVFIDGGLFAMSIVLALHSKGLGTCCLNTSYSAQAHELFRNVMPLEDDCVPIMFIAVGNLQDEYKVATSYRKPLDELVTVL